MQTEHLGRQGAPRPIVVLTGAGVSAESGVSTFRDPQGLWSKVDFRDVATPEGFARNPARLLDFYNLRRRAHSGVAPNPAHWALARLEHEYGAQVVIVTQNVDELHSRAGSRHLIHMHGEIFKAWCRACEAKFPWREDLTLQTTCPTCGAIGRLRPDIVWFGERPYHWTKIEAAIDRCGLFLSIGTSGSVYPAAGLVRRASEAGAWTIELNLEPSEGAGQFDEAVHGLATVVVPNFVKRLLKGAYR
jgi:NAD-dependent deacetylase